MSQHTDAQGLLGPAPTSYARPEEIVLRVRRHGRYLTLPVMVLVIVAAAATFWVGTFPESWMDIAAAAGAVLLILVAGIGPILAWLTRRATVTSRRVIFRHGVFVRHRSEVSFARVREVRTRRGLVQRALGAGDIDLLVGTETLTLIDVPGAPGIAEAMQELVERNYEHSTGFFGAAPPDAMAMPPQLWGGPSSTQRTQRLG